MASSIKKLAIVTGASAGIGEATAMELARMGYGIVATARRKDMLSRVVASIEARGGEAEGHILDVRNREAVAEFAKALSSRPDGRRPCVLVNNAGLARGLSTIQDGDIDAWEEMIDTNVKGLLYMTRAILPMMIEAGEGHVINVGSIAGHAAYPKGNVYCATKAAVKMLSEATSLDLVGTPVRSTLISPGMVKTEFSVVRFSGDEKRADAVYDGVEYLEASHIAEAIAWAVGMPKFVNISEITIMPTDQRSATVLHRR